MTLKSHVVSLALLTSLLATGATHAAGKIYVGAKLAVAEADIPGFDHAYLGGIYGGFNLLGKDSHFNQDLKGGTLAVEGEGLLTIRKGDAASGGNWDMKSLGVYAAYRHPLTDYFYLKGKLGLVRYEIDTSLPSLNSGTETQLAAGIGAGWKVGPGSIEVELTTYESDVLFLSGGFLMSF